MMDVPERILKKAGIFLAVFIVLQFFTWIDFVLQSAILLLALVVTNIIIIASYHLSPKLMLPNLNEKAVLITGCDSGFGHELTKKLDKLGVMVFAACLFPEGDGASKLKESCSNKLQILKLDVTKDDDVEAAVRMVSSTLQERNENLWAIVNNAGIGLAGEVEWSLMDSFYKMIEVNTIGQVRVTKAFLPLLKMSRGRVVNVTSFLGHVSYTGSTGYCMSKHAAVAFSDGLRQELMKWSISVHKIEPWVYSTNITNKKVITKTIDDNWESAPESVRKTYGNGYIESYKSLACKTIMTTARRSSAIYDVVDDMVHATIGKNPKISYVPGVIGQLWSTVATITLTELSDYISYVLSPKLTPNT